MSLRYAFWFAVPWAVVLLGMLAIVMQPYSAPIWLLWGFMAVHTVLGLARLYKASA